MLALYLSLIGNEVYQRLFERVYFSHRKQMVTLAMSILESREDAEDAVHDVFYVIAKKHLRVLQTITNEQDMKNYLLKATKNRALNMKRDRKKYVLLQDNDIVLSKEEDLNDSSFLDAICDKMTYQELVDAIRSLDGKYEEVLYLHFVLEMSVPEVAELLYRNIHTVKKQLVRGKSMLIDRLTVNGGVTRKDDKG
ncbi:MAG: sigma-70 family RNA polymerase sigma factor [Clostridia bacterium]|nr:sigma-70 family RNA polymerase sigma factor [Clostridia bacterium]MBQ7047187.1 sigma-70 family RNA polymerase sigma factor [Oscillospiraceae bacterium]